MKVGSGFRVRLQEAICAEQHSPSIIDDIERHAWEATGYNMIHMLTIESQQSHTCFNAVSRQRRPGSYSSSA
eukprot:scaffold47699_cov28-Prasinocladus_malaysianus.AAC.1